MISWMLYQMTKHQIQFIFQNIFNIERKVEDEETMAIILDIDMPDCCADCPCCDMEMVECKVSNEELTDGIFEPYAQRPSWCPLKEVKDD